MEAQVPKTLFLENLKYNQSFFRIEPLLAAFVPPDPLGRFLLIKGLVRWFGRPFIADLPYKDNSKFPSAQLPPFSQYLLKD